MLLTTTPPRADGHVDEQLTALIVEDDESTRQLIHVVLDEAGFHCEAAQDGEEGLRMARARQPRLVILDVRLPGISGYQVCRALREEHGLALPIVFISGERTEAFDRVGGLLLGADEYLAKPFAVDELLAKVRLLVQRRAGDRRSRFGLTPREFEVLSLLARGMDQGLISSTLRIRSKTVGTHIEHVLMKLEVQSRAQAVAIAYRECLVDLDSPVRAALARP